MKLSRDFWPEMDERALEAIRKAGWTVTRVGGAFEARKAKVVIASGDVRTLYIQVERRENAEQEK